MRSISYLKLPSCSVDYQAIDDLPRPIPSWTACISLSQNEQSSVQLIAVRLVGPGEAQAARSLALAWCLIPSVIVFISRKWPHQRTAALHLACRLPFARNVQIWVARLQSYLIYINRHIPILFAVYLHLLAIRLRLPVLAPVEG